MTLAERVMHKLRYWQIILNLTDWIINFKLVSLQEINQALQTEAFAYISYRSLLKTATVFLPYDLEFETIANMPAYDFLIVHELLHLIFDNYGRWYEVLTCPLPTKFKKLLDEVYADTNEEVINHLTKILIKMSMWLNLVKEGQDEEKSKEPSEGEI